MESPQIHVYTCVGVRVCACACERERWRVHSRQCQVDTFTNARDTRRTTMEENGNDQDNCAHDDDGDDDDDADTDADDEEATRKDTYVEDCNKAERRKSL